MSANVAAADCGELLQFMFRLGQALLASGEQTATVELLLRRIASSFGMRASRVVAFPTAIFISLHDGVEERTAFAEGPTQTLRLDQIADVYTLVDETQAGKIAPAEGLQRLSDILKATPRFGVLGSIVGHCILSVGVALVLGTTLENLMLVAALGAIVGGLTTLNRGRAVLAVPLPVVAAALVSSLAFASMKYGILANPLDALIPPLITFLPGAMLTLGMVELAYGDMVSGSSRLMTGFVQLVLLVFGLSAGVVLVGYRPEDLVEQVSASTALAGMPWLPWAGVIVFGLGVYFYFSAPRKSFPWMLLVLLAAFTTQQLTSIYVGQVASGFFGMLVATPLGYIVHLGFRGPPAIVTFLPSFWLLVPGALGLLSVKHMLGDRAAGIDGMVTTVFVFASIALGTLMGASLYKELTERFGWWQLQLGRVGRYFRPKKNR